MAGAKYMESAALACGVKLGAIANELSRFEDFRCDDRGEV